MFLKQTVSLFKISLSVSHCTITASGWENNDRILIPAWTITFRAKFISVTPTFHLCPVSAFQLHPNTCSQTQAVHLDRKSSRFSCQQMEECVSFPSGLSWLEKTHVITCMAAIISLSLTMRFTGYHVKLTQPHKNVQDQILMTRPTETREKTKKRGIKTCLQDRTERRGETQKCLYW